MHEIEIRVRPVTRYIVTEYVRNGDKSGSICLGEFDSEGAADRVALCVARSEAIKSEGRPHAGHATRILTQAEGRIRESVLTVKGDVGKWERVRDELVD